MRVEKISSHVLALLGLLLSGCFVRLGGPGEVLPERAVSDAVVPADPSPGCSSGDGSPEGFRAMWSGGHLRRYLLRLPPKSARLRPMPLVLNFPGWLETAHVQEQLTFMTPEAQARGMVVVYPEGVGQSWNVGRCCGRAMNEGIDDQQFVRMLVTRLERELCIDRNRVFATGMSNGGFMSFQLACEQSDTFAAVAPVAGVDLSRPCAPAHPVSILNFHGLLDPVVPYFGFIFPSAWRGIDDWAERDHCNGPPTEVVFDRGEVVCRAALGCAHHTSVTSCRINFGGHTWPGGASLPSLGHTTNTIDATRSILDFFLAHPRQWSFGR